MNVPYFIDSHCHLDFKDYGEDIERVLERADAAGIKEFLNICTQMDEAAAILATTDKHPNIYASMGIHPHDAGATLEKISMEELKSWLLEKASHPKVIALGETGLDFYYENSPRPVQKDVFRLHVEVAQETGLPLVVHTRAAQEDTIAILTEKRGEVRGVIHCFSETQWLADQALDLGFYISISGIVTFKKAEELRQVVATVPLDRLLLETDAPFLAPIPYRGKRNEPAYLVETAKVLADLKGVSLEEIATKTTENFRKLFTLPNTQA
jgi:TatD DNase family protein